MRLSDLLKRNAATVLGGMGGIGEMGEIEVKGLTLDSRDVGLGYIFAALRGEKSDGWDYAGEAVRRGASVVLASEGAPDLEGAVVLRSEDPASMYARLAASFYAAAPEKSAAATGTSGKTSCVEFLRGLWGVLGRDAVSVGTLGFCRGEEVSGEGLTTPEAGELHRRLGGLVRSGVERAALEASSHGLRQRRLDGMRFDAVGMTSFGRDHLDYHGTEEAYLEAKLRLVRELTAAGGAATAWEEELGGREFLAAARGIGLRVLGLRRGEGALGEGFTLGEVQAEGEGCRMRVGHEGRSEEIWLGARGEWQAKNALTAAALAAGCGEDGWEALGALEGLKAPRGRLELAGLKGNGARVYVDYAHTPDELETMLSGLKGEVSGRLMVVFGCGGNRDKGKRRLMGEAATRHADVVVVTDDNPRMEDAGEIRREVLRWAPGAREVGDRGEAISYAVGLLEEGDILVVAGKGHEEVQELGAERKAFSDIATVRALLED